MNTSALKKFAREARRHLIGQVSTKLEQVLHTDSIAFREKERQIDQLKKRLKEKGKAALIEEVAYTWFNRFMALRFMDANGYTRLRVVSPASGDTLPEILQEAKEGNVDEELQLDRQRLFGLIDGKLPSGNPQNEAYQMLLVAECNRWHAVMPFMFQRIQDYTELLMPDDVLSEHSIVTLIREGMTEEDCKNVEVIGWLYQFYISEKKDEVFAALAKNVKITPDNIPAATQLFTPHWIVRYLVENSLGRLYLQNFPNSRLKAHMKYYVESPEEEGAGGSTPSGAGGAGEDFLRIARLEDINFCDPACGSGHILVYAFDLLALMYEEQGYTPSEIPGLILQHNLYGIEIDDRAASLAAFALMMKARAHSRRFFRREPVQPQVISLQNIHFSEEELEAYLNAVAMSQEASPWGEKKRGELKATLRQFEQAKNFGALIQPEVASETELKQFLNALSSAGESEGEGQFQEDIFLNQTHLKVMLALKQADFLLPKYHCVVANPPYMGSGGMNKELKGFVSNKFPLSKGDLFAVFMERCLALIIFKGFMGMINQQVWMFLSSYEKLRKHIIEDTFIENMAHLGPRAFPEIGGEIVQNTAFVLRKITLDRNGTYLRLVDFGDSELKMKKTIYAIQNPSCSWRYKTDQNNFTKIPGRPIGYWASIDGLKAFENSSIVDSFYAKKGMAIGDNSRFLRLWSEVDHSKIGKNTSSPEKTNTHKWYPCLHGGEFRKWYGNQNHVVNWLNNGEEAKKRITEQIGDHWSRYIISTDFFFKEGITWTAISGTLGVRYYANGFAFTSASMCIFEKDQSKNKYYVHLILNSIVAKHLLSLLSPTLNYGIGEIKKIPLVEQPKEINFKKMTLELISISQSEWDSHETSWDFQRNPLIVDSGEWEVDGNDGEERQLPTAHYSLSTKIEKAYARYEQHWRQQFAQLHTNEEALNRIFIGIYGLEEELTPEVALEDITILKDELDRKALKKSTKQLNKSDAPQSIIGSEERFAFVKNALVFDKKEVLAQLVSYAVGCMMGRYSLEKEGLILADQGEGLEEYFGKVGSEQWVVGSEEPQLNTTHLPLNTNQYESEELQGADRMAEVDGPGGTGISDDETVSEGGGLRAGQPTEEGSGQHSEQHSGGTGAPIDEGISALPVDRSGVESGSGNADPGGDEVELSGRRDSNSDSRPADRNSKNAAHPQSPALSTPHYPPPTTFLPDDDGIIPLLAEDYFTDDVVGRFRAFLKAAFGEAHFEENLRFVEEALGLDIRSYFVREFYKGHLKRYKKRPIYWLFSSPGKHFQALVYLHRYRPDTVSKLLNDYLREFIRKLEAQRSTLVALTLKADISARDKNLAQKEIDKIDAMLEDARTYERNILYPLAARKLPLDLDDGVLVNYNRMGDAVLTVPGLNDAKARKKVKGFEWVGFEWE